MIIFFWSWLLFVFSVIASSTSRRHWYVTWKSTMGKSTKSSNALSRGATSISDSKWWLLCLLNLFFVNQLELFEYFYQQSFYSLQGKLMRRHLTEVHQHEFNTVDGEFACEKCDKKCRTFEMLSKHIKVHFKFKYYRTIDRLMVCNQAVHESVHVPCYICAKLLKQGTPMEHHIKYVRNPNEWSNVDM